LQKPVFSEWFEQGDQIGRFFVYWSNFSWAVFLMTKVGIFFGYFVLIKHGLGYTLGDFFTNSSGHPGFESPLPSKQCLPCNHRCLGYLGINI
jgi:hypothetical protein